MKVRERLPDPDALSKFAKMGIIAIVLLLVSYCLYHRDQLTLSFVVEEVKSHPSISALIMVVMYLVKSLAFVVPVVLLYMGSGFIFAPAEAIIVNIIGIWIASTIPYYIGRFYGESLVDKIYLRYPKLKRLIYLQNQNEFLFAFVIRILGVVPMELGAMFLGAFGPAYKPYIGGSILGLLPKMLAFTFLGKMITDPASPGFIITFTASLLTTVGAAVFYHFYLRNQAAEEMKSDLH